VVLETIDYFNFLIVYGGRFWRVFNSPASKD